MFGLRVAPVMSKYVVHGALTGAWKSPDKRVFYFHSLLWVCSHPRELADPTV